MHSRFQIQLVLFLFTIVSSPLWAQETLEQRVLKLEQRVQALEKAAGANTAVSGWRSKGQIKNTQVELMIMQGDWKGASYNDIGVLLQNVTQSFAPNLPDAKPLVIQVKNDPQYGPMTVYQRAPGGERIILLNTGGTSWAQYSYQYAHELCHALVMETEFKGEQKGCFWFDEMLCETASYYTMLRMTETWKSEPPYPNWTSFAPHLKGYVDDTMARYEREESLPADMTLAQWFRKNEEALIANATDRKKNSLVGKRILPLFEADPAQWNAILYRHEKPCSNFTEYLQNWYSVVPEKHKAFVKKIMDLFDVQTK